MSDKEARKYFENMPYGDDAKSSEIHGKESQQVINQMVSGLVKKYDEYMAAGDKDTAGSYSGAVKSIAKSLDNLKEIKKQFATFYGGGTGGKKLFSNWTNTQQFDVPFFLEKGRISFDKELQPVLSVTAPDGKNEVTKRVSDITQDWVIRGTEEADYMKMQQDAQKQSNTVEEPLNFDADWHVSNLLSKSDTWKSFVSDKIGGRYFLHDYLQENQDKIKSGEITDEMLHPESFNPEYDTRLHQYYSNRIKKSFDPNHQTAKERAAAEELIAKSNSKNNTENNQA